MFKHLNQRKFYEMFKSENACREYLYNLKWGKGFKCRRCQNTKCWKGRTAFHARCSKCGYDESVTAHTVFNKIQIPLVKAFSITFYVSVYKKGISCRELSKIVEVGLKAVWQFKRKIQVVMGMCVSSEAKQLTEKKFNIDGIILSHRRKNLNGLQQVSVSFYKRGSKSKTKIHFAKPFIKSEFLEPCSLVGGKYINEGKDLLIWNFRSWLTGTHHHCSAKYLKGYLTSIALDLTIAEIKISFGKS